MKLAHVTGPLTGDAFVFVLSKMKQDGFTAVLVTVSLDDWRLQRLIIVSRFAQHEQLLPVGTQSLLIDTIGIDILFILLIRSASSLQRIRTSRCMHLNPHHVHCILHSAAAINYDTCLFMRVFLEISPWLDASSSQQVRSVHLDALARSIRHLHCAYSRPIIEF
jgi:hypothetical protein